jgi:hypothetical protein
MCGLQTVGQKKIGFQIGFKFFLIKNELVRNVATDLLTRQRHLSKMGGN